MTTTYDTLQLYKDLQDLWAEANAAGTVIGRPDVLMEKITRMRDKVGVISALHLAKPAAPMGAQPIDIVREVWTECRRTKSTTDGRKHAELHALCDWIMAKMSGAQGVARCDDCNGKGVEGTASDSGQTIDVQCGGCNGTDAAPATAASATADQEEAMDAARWRWLSDHMRVAWSEGKFVSLVRIVSEEWRASINASVDRMMAGDWSDADAGRSAKGLNDAR